MLIILSTLNVIRHLSDLWQQVELASEIESNLQDTDDWGRKWLVDFNSGKTQLVLSDQSSKIGAIDVKMDASVLEQKSTLRYWVDFPFYWIGALTSLLLKLSPRNLEPWFIQWSFFLLTLCTYWLLNIWRGWKKLSHGKVGLHFSNFS